MKKDSHYTKSFYSDGLTRSKYDEFMNLAINLRDIRNEMSRIVNGDLLKYVDMSRIDFHKAMLPIIKNLAHNNFTKQLCDDIYVNYRNRFSSIKTRISFSGPTIIKFNFYKKDTKNNKKGDLKECFKIYQEASH